MIVSGQTIFKASSSFVGASVEIQGADRVSFGVGGTKTSTDGVVQTGVYLGPTYSPSSSTTTVTNVLSFPTFSPPMGVTISTAAHVYLQTGAQGGAGTVTNGYNLYVDNAGFGTNRYCAFFNGKVGIVTLTPQNNLDVSGAVAIGSYAGVNTAPSNGMIVSGQTIFKSPATFLGGSVEIGGSDKYSFVIADTKTTTDGTLQVGSYLAPTFSPSSNTSFVFNMYAVPTFSPPMGVTITTGANVWIDDALQSGAGSVTTFYNLFIATPQTGTTSYAASIQGGMVHRWNGKNAAYTITTNDYYVALTGTGTPRTFTLPATMPDAGWTVVVKDEGGGAATNNLTVAGGGHNIDGAANYVINTNYGAVRIYSNGTQYYTW